MIKLNSMNPRNYENFSFYHSYRQRFDVDVEPLIDGLVDKAKVEESEYRAQEFQKQVHS